MNHRQTSIMSKASTAAVAKHRPQGRSEWRGIAPLLGVALLLFGPLVGTARAQVLETESARLLLKGAWKLGGNLEFQTSSDGKEIAMPLSLEYGITDNWELLLEPVSYASIRPKGVSSTSGLGDTEVTLTHRFRAETDGVPALAWAAEVKLPTANDKLIGTGKTDYAGYLIASKRFGDLDLHANFSYTIVGNPVGAALNNIYGFALGTIYRPDPGYEFFAEILANTASSSGEGDTSGAIVPEAANGEFVGTIGVGKFFTKNVLGFVGLSDDNNGAVQVRLGFTIAL